jgi:cytoskeletal protein CcmA (bactofilin family)
MYLSYKKRTSIPAIITHKLEIAGNLRLDGLIEIFGKVRGECNGGIINIKKDGFFEGEIVADYVRIEGEFHGKISARLVELVRGSKIIGEIEYGFINIDEEVVFNGQCKLNASLYKNIPEIS